MTAPILEIKNLSVLFRQDPPGQTVPAADRVSLDVGRGSWTSLVGESGSGKSVTALSITRLLEASSVSGEIYFSEGGFEKKNVLEMSPAEILSLRGRRIAYVFQDPSLSFNPVMKIGAQIDEAYRAHFDVSKNETAVRTKKFLASVKIKDVDRVYDSFPHELSGGMKQRAMIAMALVSEPRLLIADEPTTALDVMTESEIISLLLDIQKERSLTILFITHDLSLAARQSDVIFVMKKGRVVERMEKESGIFSPKMDYSKRLFEARAAL